MDNQIITYAAISLGIWANVSTFLSIKRQVQNYIEDQRWEEYRQQLNNEAAQPTLTIVEEKK